MSETENDRYFLHELNDSVPPVSMHDIKNVLEPEIQKTCAEIVDNFPASSSSSNPAMYVGSAGIALMFCRLCKESFEPQRSRYLSCAEAYIKVALIKFQKTHPEMSFIMGVPGALAIAAEIDMLQGEADAASLHLDALEAGAEKMLSAKTDGSDELLYGRAGLIYALLYAHRNVQARESLQSLADRHAALLLQSGTRPNQSHLMYEWHGTPYLGAAHGLAGILYVLMCCDNLMQNSNASIRIKASMDFLLELQQASGNFPSQTGRMERDELVHWCHGAPGLVPVLLKAYELFEDPRYLMAAERACDTIWQRGLLRKGRGLCHGITGNAYAFLAMHRVTREDKYLNRALHFAVTCCDPTFKQGLHVPDAPWSLFEGEAGAVCFFLDLMTEPSHALFPAFEL